MPRKQRFKPSRKPKPSPQTEEAIGQSMTNTSSAASELDARETSSQRDDDRATEAEVDQRSR